MGWTLHPHDYVKIPGTDLTRITTTNDYIRLQAAGQTLYVQTGEIYYEGGEVVTEPPGWFWDEVRKCTAEALMKAGCDRAFLERVGVTLAETDAPPQWLVDAMKEYHIETPTVVEPEAVKPVADDITAPEPVAAKPVIERQGETQDEPDTSVVAEPASAPQPPVRRAKVVKKTKTRIKHGDSSRNRPMDKAGRPQDNVG